jgi:hypothetical protein
VGTYKLREVVRGEGALVNGRELAFEFTLKRVAGSAEERPSKTDVGF